MTNVEDHLFLGLLTRVGMAKLSLIEGYFANVEEYPKNTKEAQ